MKKPVSFKITEDNEFEEEEEEVPVRGGASCAVDPVLYSMMKDLRKKLSKRLEVPPFVIFQDPSLEAMATTYPITLDELQNIPGVGAGKAKRYGKEFIELIKKHVEENEIERPEDLRVRTVANKSKLKVSIIQRIDRKVALDEIALTNGLEFTELLDEIEAIVYSGTRINIDYFLNDVMDEAIDSSNDYRFNPIRSLKEEYRKYYINNLQMNGYVSYEFIKGLKLKVSGGYTYDARKNDQFNNSNTRYGGPTSTDKVNAQIIRNERLTWLNENTLTYQTNIKKKHFFNSLIGITFQNSDYEYYSLKSTHIPNESLGMAGMADGTLSSSSSLKSSWAMMSYLARLNYNYNLNSAT